MRTSASKRTMTSNWLEKCVINSLVNNDVKDDAKSFVDHEGHTHDLVRCACRLLTLARRHIYAAAFIYTTAQHWCSIFLASTFLSLHSRCSSHEAAFWLSHSRSAGGRRLTTLSTMLAAWTRPGAAAGGEGDFRDGLFLKGSAWGGWGCVSVKI